MELSFVMLWGAQFIIFLLAAWVVIRYVDPYVVLLSTLWDKQFSKYKKSKRLKADK